MTAAFLLLAAVAPASLHDAQFHLPGAAEAVATVRAACAGCDWGAKGREAAVLQLELDGRPGPRVVLTRGGSADYRVLLGALDPGTHRLEVRLDRRLSARRIGGARVEDVSVEGVPVGVPPHEALAHAPILHTRRRSLERFSDIPLVAWVETSRAPDGGREHRYSVVFSHEDGGTPLDRLMATWGRATDIELVYLVELDAGGRVRRAEYQGRNHEMKPFLGRREGAHPVLFVTTDNNMVSDRGESTPREAPAPFLFALDGVSREAVMDAHPWTYQVSAAEVRREGRVREDARPGSKRIPDPRRFAYVEACGQVIDTRLAFDAGVETGTQGLAWVRSDAGGPAFRIARSGCFRSAVPLSSGATAGDVRRLRVRAHTRPPRKGEAPLPRGSGFALIDRVNLLFDLAPDGRPAPREFRWGRGAEITPDGPPLELATEPPKETRQRVQPPIVDRHPEVHQLHRSPGVLGRRGGGRLRPARGQLRRHRPVGAGGRPRLVRKGNVWLDVSAAGGLDGSRKLAEAVLARLQD